MDGWYIFALAFQDSLFKQFKGTYNEPIQFFFNKFLYSVIPSGSENCSRNIAGFIVFASSHWTQAHCGQYFQHQ